jgi:hypothetical protein
VALRSLPLSAHEIIGRPSLLSGKHTLIEATVEGLPTGLGLFPEPIRERRCVLVAYACRRWEAAGGLPVAAPERFVASPPPS